MIRVVPAVFRLLSLIIDPVTVLVVLVVLMISPLGMRRQDTNCQLQTLSKYLQAMHTARASRPQSGYSN